MAISVGNTTAGQSSSSSTSYTLSHNLSAGSGNNRLLIVQVSLDVSGPPTLSCTYNGESMTLIDSAYLSGMQVATFYLLDADLPSASGSYNIVASSTEAGYLKIIALDATGVKQQAPEAYGNATVNDSTISKSLTTLTDGALVFYGAANGSSSGTWSGLTSEYTQAGSLTGGSAHTAVAAYKIESSSGSKTLTATNSQSWYSSLVAAAFEEYTAPTARSQVIFIM